MREQTRKERAMDAVGVDRRFADRDAHGARKLAELTVDVLPFAHPQIVEVLAAAHAPKRARTEVALLLL